MKKCPYCKHWNFRSKKRCPHCGSKLLYEGKSAPNFKIIYLVFSFALGIPIGGIVGYSFSFVIFLFEWKWMFASLSALVGSAIFYIFFNMHEKK